MVQETIQTLVKSQCLHPSTSVSIEFSTVEGFDETTKTLTIDSSAQSPTVLQVTTLLINGDEVSLNDLVWTLNDTTYASFAGGGTSLDTANGAGVPFFATGTEGSTTATITCTVNDTSYTVATITVISQEISG